MNFRTKDFAIGDRFHHRGGTATLSGTVDAPTDARPYVVAIAGGSVFIAASAIPRDGAWSMRVPAGERYLVVVADRARIHGPSAHSHVAPVVSGQ